MRRHLEYTISYHQAFYQHGVALYNIVIDVDNVFKKLGVRFDGSLGGFLADAYVSLIRVALTGFTDSSSHRVINLLRRMRELLWLSTWFHKSFVGALGFRSVINLALDLNAVTDYDVFALKPLPIVRLTSVGSMLLHLYGVAEGLSDEELYEIAKKIAEFPKKLLDAATKHLDHPGADLYNLTMIVMEDLDKEYNIRESVPTSILGYDILHLLALYNPDSFTFL